MNPMVSVLVYDASFRIPNNILRGNSFSLGNYRQCLAINQPLEDSSIQGKYCLIQTESLDFPILTGDSWPANVTWIKLNTALNSQNLEAYELARQELSMLSSQDRLVNIHNARLIFSYTLSIYI